MQEAKTLRSHIGQAKFWHQTLLDEVTKPIEQGQLLPRGIPSSAPMQLDSIQMPSQPLFTGIKRTLKAAATQPPREWSQLGCHLELFGLSRIHGAEELTQQKFAAPIEATRAVGIGGVHKRQSALNSCTQRGLKIGIVAIRLVTPQQLVAPGPSSKSDSRHASHSLCTP